MLCCGGQVREEVREEVRRTGWEGAYLTWESVTPGGVGEVFDATKVFPNWM